MVQSIRSWLSPKGMVAAALALACAGCENKVYVECEGKGEKGFECVVSHKKGSQTAKACWEVNVTCKNGTKVSGSACETVKPEQKVTKVIPLSELKNLDKCDSASETKVENLKLTLE